MNTDQHRWEGARDRREGQRTMHDFPEFMKSGANKIASGSQATPGVEGYVFDGVDGMQMAFWTCRETAASVAHVHDFDEYMLVVQGHYTLILEDERVALNAGDEYFIPRGVRHAGEVAGGTRTIHCFGGRRAERANTKPQMNADEKNLFTGA